MAASNFPAFLRSKVINPFASPCRSSYASYDHRLSHQYSRPFHSRHSRTAVAMQSDDDSCFTFPADGRIGPNPLRMLPIAQSDTGAANSLVPAPDGLFDEFLHYSDNCNRFGELGNLSQWRDTNGANPIHFHPTDRVNGSCNDNFSSSDFLSETHDNMLGKIDNSPVAPNFTVLSHQVDPSTFEHIDHATWLLSSVDYEAPSPTSIDTQSNGPETPMSPLPSSALSCHLSTSSLFSNLAKTGTVNFSNPPPSHVDELALLPLTGQCQCLNCTAAFAARGPPLTVWDATRPQTTTRAVSNTHSQSYGLPMHAVSTLSAENSINAPLPPNPTTASLLQDLEQSAFENSPEPSDSGDETEPDVNEKSMTEAAHRRDRDQYLLKMREKGFSYKEIKRRGRFKEAESTLRGRVRVLTKDKSERVRKPAWTTNDLHLLNRAVDRFRVNGHTVPWKKVSDWMHDRGSSYFFAPATCARKWREMN